jgi:tape measure domain-containing protein
MSEIYTISLDDQVTGNAYRIAGALADVSVAMQYLNRSVKQNDKDMMALDQRALKLARSELAAARAAKSAGDAAAKLSPRLQNVKPPALPVAPVFRFSYALNALANQAMSTAFALARNLASAALQAGKSLYDTADLATRAHQSFANFFGGQAAGDQTLRESIDIAKRYGFTIEDTIAQMNRFGAAGFNQEQSKGLLRFGADMMAAGRSVQDVKGIFLAMTQIQGKGKLQAEELTQQLAERGINAGRVWEILAKKFNTTKDLVMKMQKAGKIMPGAALNAIVQAGVEGVHGAKIGKAGEAVADATVGGLGRRMSTLIESSIFDAVDRATPALTRGMQALFRGMGLADTSGLQDSLTRMLEGVGAFLEKIGPQMPAVVANFQKAFGAATGFNGASLQGFADSLPGIATGLGQIAGFLVRIAAAGTQIAGWLGGSANDRATSTTASIFRHNSASAEHLTLGAENGLYDQRTRNAIQDQIAMKTSDDMIAEDMSAKLGKGYELGIKSSASGVAKATTNLAEQSIDAFKDATDIHSPSKVFKGFGSNISQSVALGVDSDADLAMHSTKMMAESAIAASAGASGLDPRRAIAAGSAAGDAVSSRSSALTVRVGDVHLGGGSSGGGGDAEAVRDYFETEFVSMLERHLEGVGA